MKRCLSILMIWFCAVSALHAEGFVKIEIRDAIRKKAVCNDGSPGIYYFRPGSGTGAKRWVITLTCGIGYCGGPYCDGSSKNSPSVRKDDLVGINSSSQCENPDFYNANQAFLLNCTQDMYSGNHTWVGGAGPIEFRGRNYVRYAVQDLIDRSGSTLNEPGTEVLFYGTSCGGIGVMTQLDWLARKLPNAKVRGLNDSGWIFPSKIISYDKQHEALKAAIQVWKSEVDEDCAKANPSDKSLCFLSLAYPYTKTPMFVQFTQWDYHVVEPDPSNPRTKKFSSEVRRSLTPVTAAFSSQFPTSAVAYREHFISVKVNGYSLADLLGNWFFDRAGPVKEISTVPNLASQFVCPKPRQDLQSSKYESDLFVH